MALISVIIPSWNRADFLATAIDSVLAQSYTDFELIVVDDGSTDGTAELAAGYGNRVTVLHQHNKGPSAARNLGVSGAQGDYIAFLDSDDWWHKDKLAQQLAAMEAEPDFLISHTDEIWYRRGTFLNQKKKHTRPHGYIFALCLKLCCVGMSTVMVRRRFFTEVEPFNEQLPCCEDYDLWLRASVTLPFLKIDAPLTYKQGGRADQVSQRFRLGMDRFRIFAMLSLLAEASLAHEQQTQLVLELCRKCTIYGNGCVKHGREEEGREYLHIVEQLESGDVASVLLPSLYI